MKQEATTTNNTVENSTIELGKWEVKVGETKVLVLSFHRPPFRDVKVELMGTIDFPCYFYHGLDNCGTHFEHPDSGPTEGGVRPPEKEALDVFSREESNGYRRWAVDVRLLQKELDPEYVVQQVDIGPVDTVICSFREKKRVESMKRLFYFNYLGANFYDHLNYAGQALVEWANSPSSTTKAERALHAWQEVLPLVKQYQEDRYQLKLISAKQVKEEFQGLEKPFLLTEGPETARRWGELLQKHKPA